MFLKRNKNFYYIILVIIFSFKNSLAADDNINQIIKYLSSINNFSVSFIQEDVDNISEGKISVGDQRIRVDYLSPSKIIIILSKNKGMYYNIELDEDEFFDTRDTSAWFFFEIFNNPNFFLESNVEIKNNNIILEKQGKLKDNESYLLKLYFEKNPTNLRKITLDLDEYNLSLSVFGHNYNANFDKNFFKLINPSFFY
tara:strand:+ start:839 stop:1432 length:594 start_codon:yes stop_codon:yes gene_type:complete